MLLAACLSVTFIQDTIAQGRQLREVVVSSVHNMGNYNKFIYNGNSIAMSQETEGTNYLYDDWQPATLTMAGDTLEIPDVEVKIDLVNRVIEVRQDDKTTIFPSFLISKTTITSDEEIIIPRKVVGKDGPPGFYALLYGNESFFLCHYSLQRLIQPVPDRR